MLATFRRMMLTVALTGSACFQLALADNPVIFRDAFVDTYAINCNLDAPDTLSISAQTLVNRGDPITLSVSGHQQELDGIWIVRNDQGRVYQQIPVTNQTQITIEIQDPGFYTVSLCANNPSPAVSNLHHLAVATPLSGNIVDDTELSASESPYQLMGTIQIRQESNLTIPRGTVIFGNGHAIIPFGTLTIAGHEDQPVVIYNADLKGGATQSQGPYFFLDIDNLVMLSGSFQSPGIAGYGTLSVKNSIFLNLSESTYTYIWYPTSKVSITENIFWGINEISFGVMGTAVDITNNLFRNYTNLHNEGVLQNWANYGDSAIVVKENSFLDVGKSTLGVRINGRYRASRNYWGTTDRAMIENMIHDGNDDFAIPQIIDFEPFLLEPHPDTPTLEDCRARIKYIPTVILTQMGNPSFCE